MVDGTLRSNCWISVCHPISHSSENIDGVKAPTRPLLTDCRMDS